MRRGLAYILVVIATACEFLARYLIKGRLPERRREIQVIVKPKWIN